MRGGREIVRLDLEMSVGAPDPHDAIVIDGDPPLDVVIRGGTHGDRGTVGTVLSAIPAVVAASPGLKTVLDLALRCVTLIWKSVSVAPRGRAARSSAVSGR